MRTIRSRRPVRRSRRRVLRKAAAGGALLVAGCISGRPDGGVRPETGGTTATATHGDPCPDPPATDTAPESLLPNPPGEWTATEVGTLVYGPTGLDPAAHATYAAPGGYTYAVVVGRSQFAGTTAPPDDPDGPVNPDDRWGAPFIPVPHPDADEGYPVFGNGTVDRDTKTVYADVRVELGEFRFGALGPDRTKATRLLAASPALTNACIDDRAAETRYP